MSRTPVLSNTSIGRPSGFALVFSMIGGTAATRMTLATRFDPIASFAPSREVRGGQFTEPGANLNKVQPVRVGLRSGSGPWSEGKLVAHFAALIQSGNGVAAKADPGRRLNNAGQDGLGGSGGEEADVRADWEDGGYGWQARRANLAAATGNRRNAGLLELRHC